MGGAVLGPHSVVNDSKPQTGEMDGGAELMSGEAARYSR